MSDQNEAFSRADSPGGPVAQATPPEGGRSQPRGAGGALQPPEGPPEPIFVVLDGGGGGSAFAWFFAAVFVAAGVLSIGILYLWVLA